MLKRLTLFLFTTIFTFAFSYGQNDLDTYKRIYKIADSLNARGHKGRIDTISLFTQAIKLDEKHPSAYFETSGKLLTESKFNEAAFIYYLGLMRFRYYNSSNPDYQASGDGALLGSLKYVFGEPINMYLKTDIDNFITIIKLAINYYSNNDFKFYSKNKSVELFNAQIKSYEDLVLELEANKEKYKAAWTIERKTMEENIDKLIVEQENQV